MPLTTREAGSAATQTPAAATPAGALGRTVATARSAATVRSVADAADVAAGNGDAGVVASGTNAGIAGSEP